MLFWLRNANCSRGAELLPAAAAEVAEDATPGRTGGNPLVIAGQTAGVGFVGYIFVIGIFMKYGAMPNIIAPLTFFYFAALFGICFMIMRHNAGSAAATINPPAENTQDPPYLRSVTTAQLEEAREFGIGSVTDATTRTLDKMPFEDRRN